MGTFFSKRVIIFRFGALIGGSRKSLKTLTNDNLRASVSAFSLELTFWGRQGRCSQEIAGFGLF